MDLSIKELENLIKIKNGELEKKKKQEEEEKRIKFEKEKEEKRQKIQLKLEKYENEIDKINIDKDEDNKGLFQVSLMKKIIEIEMDLQGGYIDNFDNRDYCSETCEGWDGFSRRCDCGNRRIDWSVSFCFSNHRDEGCYVSLRAEPY
jgi:hypothetical protein